MKKKLISLTVTSVLLVTLAAGCTAKTTAAEVPPVQSETPMADTTSPATDKTVLPEILDINILLNAEVLAEEKAIAFTVQNPLEVELTYGFAFTIEKMDEKKSTWIKTTLTDDLAFIEMLGIIPSKGKVEDKINLNLITGLETARYRILRPYHTEDGRQVLLYISFDVNKDGSLKIN